MSNVVIAIATVVSSIIKTANKKDSIDCRNLKQVSTSLRNYRSLPNRAKFNVNGKAPEGLTQKRIGTTGKEFTLLDIAFRVADKTTEYCPNNWNDVLQECFIALCWTLVAWREDSGVKIQTLAYKACNMASRDYLRRTRKTDPTWIVGDGKLTMRQLLESARNPSEKRERRIAHLESQILLGDKKAEAKLRRLRKYIARNVYLYNPETIELRSLRSFGINGLDDIVPRGRWIQIRLASHQPLDGDDENQAIQPEDRTDAENRKDAEHSEEWEAFKASRMNEKELSYFQEHCETGRGFTAIARSRGENPNTGKRIGDSALAKAKEFWEGRYSR